MSTPLPVDPKVLLAAVDGLEMVNTALNKSEFDIMAAAWVDAFPDPRVRMEAAEMANRLNYVGTPQVKATKKLKGGTD